MMLRCSARRRVHGGSDAEGASADLEHVLVAGAASRIMPRSPRPVPAANPDRRGALRSSGSGAHFTHFDASGQAHMVDVGDKPVTRRIARAGGRITMTAATAAMIRQGTAAK